MEASIQRDAAKPGRRVVSFFRNFGNELLLNSGQYALFYIVMNFSQSGVGYFTNLGHTLLLLILIFQTSALVLVGQIPIARFLFSLTAPAVYTAIEFSTEGVAFVLNMGHMFFWIFSAVTGATQAVSLAVEDKRVRKTLEFFATALNVLVFIVVYFYFDVKLGLTDRLAAGDITDAEYLSRLEIGWFFRSFVDFVRDPAHTYLLAAGFILAMSLAIGRVRILELKEKIADLFGLYVDRKIRDRIIESGEKLSSERRNVAILFSDIRNFTPLAESTPPDKLTAMLNRYFSKWNETVRRHHGVIDKYIGDAVMVVFGLEHPDEAVNDAVSAAIDMLDSFPETRQGLIDHGLPAIEAIGIGINYGEVIFGDIGSDDRRNYTVIGDTVNVASRLEAACKVAGRPLILSDAVYELLDPPYRERFEALGHAKLKGKNDRVSVYGVKKAAASGHV